MIKIKANVLNVTEEDREFLSKDGVSKIKRHITHVLMVAPDGSEVFKIRTFNPIDPKNFPVAQKPWETPAVIKYEFNNGVSEVMV